MPARKLAVRAERWPIAGGFAISRGRKTHAHVVVAEIAEAGASGRGECVPYPRYGESVESVIASVEGVRSAIEAGADRAALARSLPAGAARNALDCALWDLEAKRRGEPVWRRAGLPEPRAVVTAYTISLDTPAAMAEAARAAAARPLLKLKLGSEEPLARVAAVREAAPAARLIADANEAWTAPQLERLAPGLAQLGVELVEQPLPAGADAALRELERPVRLCADESCRDAGLERLVGLYDVVNVKLDKTGGLTGALAQVAEARRLGFGIMLGCMVGTSLAMAPAVLLAGSADYVDLDGPLLLERDRQPGIRFEGSLLHPPPRELWG
jgi:L-alanine-DL-glutamate epimerase-like enolase superfamily enzyme